MKYNSNSIKAKKTIKNVVLNAYISCLRFSFTHWSSAIQKNSKNTIQIIELQKLEEHENSSEIKMLKNEFLTKNTEIMRNMGIKLEN